MCEAAKTAPAPGCWCSGTNQYVNIAPLWLSSSFNIINPNIIILTIFVNSNYQKIITYTKKKIIKIRK